MTRGTRDQNPNGRSRSDTPTSRTGECDRKFPLGLYGWRKKSLYLLIFALMLLIVLNLGLTLWILKVMEFSTDGMGQLKVMPGGLQLSGQTVVMDQLRASTIRPRHGQPITIESARNLTINTRDEQGMLQNQLFLGHDRVEVLASVFRVTDTHGKSLFSVADNEVSVGADSLRVEGEGGAIFRESIQTPLVRADAGRELRLESPTRALEMSAAQEVLLHSRAGSLEATSLGDMKLISTVGGIHLDSPNILIPNLKIAPHRMSLNHENGHGMHQVCSCANGKLFLVASHGICAGDEHSVCR